MAYYDTLTAETGIEMMGEDFFVTIEYHVTCRGYKGSWDEPPYDPEFDIERIILEREYWDDGEIVRGAEWIVDSGKLFDCLCENDAVISACLEGIVQEEENDWREYDEDYYRDR